MNQKGFANLIVIGIILAVVLGVGGYFVLVRKPSKTQQEPSNVPTISQLTTNKPSSSQPTSSMVPSGEGISILECQKSGGVISVSWPRKCSLNGKNISIQETPERRDGVRIYHFDVLRTALELYYDDHNSYPTTLTGLNELVPRRLAELPRDPLTNHLYSYAVKSDSNRKGKFSSYHLGATLETRLGPNPKYSFVDNDRDFDSRNQPLWVNGFSGADNQKCNSQDTGIICYDFVP